MNQVHQFLPSLGYGDAIGNHVIQLRDLLGSRFDSQMFFEHCDPRMRAEGLHYWQYDERKTDGGPAKFIYHSSIGSGVAHYLSGRDEPLLIDYHDLTPPGYLAPYDSLTAELLEEGHFQLQWLSEQATFAWAHSEFARRDLEKVGYTKTAVLPILLDFSKFDRPPDERAVRWMKETSLGGPTILFVGRIAPNKHHQDLIKLVRVYNELFDSPARLILCGGIASRTDPYAHALTDLARDLGVSDNVTLTGSVPLANLRAYYAASDVFVCMSEHEGFGVPLIESMYLGLPVVAHAAAAVPETVGTGGLILEQKDYVQFAVAVHRLFTDADARHALVEAGKARVAEFDPKRVAQQYLDTLLPLL